MSAHCFHAGCAGNGWQQFKEKIGKPDNDHYDPPMVRVTIKGARDQTPEQASGATDSDEPVLGVAVILDYFRDLYRPQFRRGTAIYTASGETILKTVACDVPNSRLIEKLASAIDAPKFAGGGVKRDSLPGFFRKWASVAWGDLLATLPDEDTAELGIDGPAGEEFARLVREAMLSEVVLGDLHSNDGALRTERRSLIDWCHRFAKPGPWRGIRSKKCWCKVREKDGGELELMVAIRHELFAQLSADRRLREMGQKVFARRADRYGIGSCPRDDRPHGLRCIVLASAFVADLIAGLPDDDDPFQDGSDCPER